MSLVIRSSTLHEVTYMLALSYTCPVTVDEGGTAGGVSPLGSPFQTDNSVPREGL